MSSAKRWMVCGGDVAKDVRNVLWMKESMERSCGGSAPSGVEMEVG